MQREEIQSIIEKHLGSTPGFSAGVAQQFASHLASAMSAIPSKGGGSADCYKKCQETRDAAMAACALQPWPASVACIGQAVLAFNACRHACDAKGG